MVASAQVLFLSLLSRSHHRCPNENWCLFGFHDFAQAQTLSSPFASCADPVPLDVCPPGTAEREGGLGDSKPPFSVAPK
jgi:hypothetical protein